MKRCLYLAAASIISLSVSAADPNTDPYLSAPTGNPIPAPIAIPVDKTTVAPNIAPVVAPVVAPATELTATPVVAPIAIPVVNAPAAVVPAIAPVALPDPAPPAQPVTAPVTVPAASVAIPPLEPVVTPTIAPAIQPVAQPEAAPVKPAATVQAPVPAKAAPVNANPYLQHAAPQQWIGVTQTPYGPMMMQLAPPPPYRDYQMNRIIKPEEKKRWLQMAMPMMANMMKMDAREAMNYFAIKIKAKPGLSFDEVVESMMLRANQVNLKFVGSNLMWKDFKVVLNDDTAPRIEVFSFCDIEVGRDLLRIIPEMAVFLPCRITVMEDADKNIWILTLDWDVTWLDLAGKDMGITPELRDGAIAVRQKMDNVMRAAANGEL